jgi:serine phosphatase RsbU (regulator of sigma subunit)
VRGGLRLLALVLLASLSLFALFSPTAQILRHAVFDSYQRLFPLERAASPVVVVVIDENAIARYGQWPWPRTRVAELISQISRHEPASIGLDLIFPEPDRFSPGEMATQLPLLSEELKRILQQHPSNDQLFADAIRGNRVVLGISAENQPDARFARAPLAAPVVVGPEAAAGLRRYPAHLGNLAVIDQAAAGRGLMNSGPLDQVVRVVPLAAQVQGTIVPSLGVETLRVAVDSGLRLRALGNGLLELAFADAVTRLQDDGNTWLRFSAYDSDDAVPAATVLSGEVKPELLRGKAVLVGVSGLGLQDYKTTPLGQFIPGVFVHAQVIENLYNRVSLVRPEYTHYIEVALMLLCGLVLILVVPRLSAMQSINLAVAMSVVLVGAGLIAFVHQSILFDPAWPVIGTLAVFLAAVVGTLSEAERQRRVLREQAAHMAGEVDAARRIQMGLLPNPDETLAHDRRFRLAATLEPARTVGGDFYDCFMVDARRLVFLVADVSGKGLAAALFMAAAKSHIKSAALREHEIGEALTRAQDEIVRENPEQLFVTAFAGSLDVQSGVLEYANAGHEPPFRRKRNGAPERLGPPGGPPLCVMEDFDYPTERLQLESGEWLCLVTDGATEAMNPAREFFGLERLRASLSWVGEDAAPAEVVRRLRDDVQRFADGAEPADDITLMALRWDGVKR